MSNTQTEGYKLPSIQVVPLAQAVMDAAGHYSIPMGAEAEPLSTGAMVVPSILVKIKTSSAKKH